MGRRALLQRFLPRTLWGDRVYGRYLFHGRLGRYPEDPPVGFNDHLFALKTSGGGYHPLIQFVTDKEYAKLYISSVLGEQYVIDTYRILQTREEWRNYQPNRFPCVIKPTHLSGAVLICTDPLTPLQRTRRRNWFDTNYYERSREHNYRYLVPKIIVEEFFSDNGHTVPNDYKIFCFRGKPKFVQVDFNRFSGHTRNLYDTSWTRISATLGYPNEEEDGPKPALLEDMLHAAQELSAPFPFVRIDMYALKKKVKIGELTFFPAGAAKMLNPPEAEFILGAYFRDN